jgi:hypothetical protein
MVDPAVPELTPGYPPVAVAIRPAAMASLSRPGGSTQTLWRRPTASTLIVPPGTSVRKLRCPAGFPARNVGPLGAGLRGGVGCVEGFRIAQ